MISSISGNVADPNCWGSEQTRHVLHEERVVSRAHGCSVTVSHKIYISWSQTHIRHLGQMITRSA
jgi:hypothetical protein